MIDNIKDNREILNNLNEGWYALLIVGSPETGEVLHPFPHSNIDDIPEIIERYNTNTGYDCRYYILQLVEPPAEATIEVLGGVASVETVSTGVSVEITDHDIEEEEDRESEN